MNRLNKFRAAAAGRATSSHNVSSLQGAGKKAPPSPPLGLSMRGISTAAGSGTSGGAAKGLATGPARNNESEEEIKPVEEECFVLLPHGMTASGNDGNGENEDGCDTTVMSLKLSEKLAEMLEEVILEQALSQEDGGDDTIMIKFGRTPAGNVSDDGPIPPQI